jgi:uncharacterized Zn-finger protein
VKIPDIADPPMEDWTAERKVRKRLSYPRISAFTLEIGCSDSYGANMTDTIVPHFHNTSGVAVIEIGAREFMCVGELPPFDHPHVFLDMGDASEIICPYCSTLFRYDSSLGPRAARPPECALADEVTA